MRVFVYGTLKPGEIYYPIYCQDKITGCARKVYTFGQLYYLKALGYPALTTGTNKVEGYLLTFKSECYLKQLDQLEDYVFGRTEEENEYQREIIQVYDYQEHFKQTAWAYLMRSDKIALYQGVLIQLGWFSSS